MEPPSLLEQVNLESKVATNENSDKITTLSSSLSSSFPYSLEDVGCKGPIEQVDSFLIDALNSRSRLTVLRIDQEVERFMQNPSQQQLQFWPMRSSYERLAAHRVAQYYNLYSTVTDCGGAVKSSRIVLVKTPDCRIPDIRLVDIPVESSQQEKANIMPEKFAIKQRQSGILRSNESSHNLGEPYNATPIKTVEERSEEYNKARARIFNSLDTIRQESEASDDVSTVKSATLDRLTMFETRGILSNEDVGNGSAVSTKPSASRVAIFRDQEKDRKDPDYDRTYDRYFQRLNGNFGMPSSFGGTHFINAPLLTISSDFSRPDGSTGSQAWLEQVPYQHQSLWTGSVGSMRLYPNAFLGQFPHGQSPTQSMYFATQSVSHLDHYNYMEDGIADCFQHGCQCQGTSGR